MTTKVKLSVVVQWQSGRLEFEKSLGTPQRRYFVSVSNTLSLLLCTGSTPEDRGNLLT